jgi:hypothetical protein
MVMLSQPTPPVSLFEARQLSIMFWQMSSRGCLATIPRLTNSTTACEDWQSQIPANLLAQLRVRWAEKVLTIACNDQELVILVDVVYLDVRERGDYLLLGWEIGALLELKVTYRTRQGEVAVDAAKVDETTSCLDARFLGCEMLAWCSDRGAERRAFILRLVVEREGLCSALDSQNSSRIAGIGLFGSVFAGCVLGRVEHTQ